MSFLLLANGTDRLLLANGTDRLLLAEAALQTLRPDGDVQVGSWQNELGATTNLYQSIDETSTDDADYVTRSL